MLGEFSDLGSIAETNPVRDTWRGGEAPSAGGAHAMFGYRPRSDPAHHSTH